MIRLFWRFALLVVLASGFAWLADSPGFVTIQWQGKEIRTSVVAAVAIALIAMVLAWYIWGLFRRLWRSPRSMGEYWRFRKNRKGYDSLSRGIIAAGAGDAAAASKHAAIAGNALADEPLVNVLAAQAAQLKGDRASVKRIFEAMTKSPDTEALGLRGLFSEARQAGDIASAKIYAERALRLNPRLAWASASVLQLQSLSKDWSGAAATLAQQAKSGLLMGEEGNRKQAVMLAAEALALEDTDRTRALSLATRAHKLDPELIPAALVAARIHTSQGSPRKASRILKDTWSRFPHPDLAEVFAHLKPGDGPEIRFERVRDLASNGSDLESAYALARAAALAQRWDVARRALEPYLADQPQARLCVLMADIEEAQGDKGRAREWLARAVKAPRDPMWVSDGVASPRWAPVSPVSGEIVPCEWKSPFEMPADDKQIAESAPVAVIASPKPQAKPVDVPRTVEYVRPPDDPGPEIDVRRAVVTDG